LAFTSRPREARNCPEKRKMELMKTLRPIRRTKITPSRHLRSRMKLTERRESARKKNGKSKKPMRIVRACLIENGRGMKNVNDKKKRGMVLRVTLMEQAIS
jgi:hypothetical protein